MNLALQKRHEQLERWRQNEANAESLHQSRSDDNSQLETNYPETKRETSSSTSSQSYKSRNLNSNPEARISRSNDDHDNSKYTKTNKDKKNRSSGDLQVKFSNSTLFLTACANGDINECDRLINDNQVHIDATTSDGLTGLHEAAICGNAQMVEYLIKKGANVNCCDNEGWTPLHAASSLGQVKVVEILLNYNADATIVNCENLLAYDLARNDQVQTLIGEHLQGVDIDFLRSQEERAIQQDIERWLQTGHYDERSHPVTNATVLHVLAAKGHLKLLKQILESPVLKKQINLEAKDNEGFTPLLAASFWSQMDIVELLIEHGCNIFAQANNGYKISSIVSITVTYIWANGNRVELTVELCASYIYGGAFEYM